MTSTRTTPCRGARSSAWTWATSTRPNPSPTRSPRTLPFHEKLLIHTSRPIRWDSDHVVLFGDDVRNVFLEVVRCRALDRVYVALDFFDASINRIGAYVIGTRATRKAILYALLDPTESLKGTGTGRKAGAETRPDGRHENNALRRSLGNGLPDIRRPPRRRVDLPKWKPTKNRFCHCGDKEIRGPVWVMTHSGPRLASVANLL